MFIRYFIVSISILLFSGCGNNNSESISTTSKASYSNSIVVLNGRSIDITQNSQSVEIKVQAYDINNTPITDGVINVSYPSQSLEGESVGVFLSSSVSIVDSVATFNYVAPNSLVSDKSYIFSFYYEDDTTNLEELTINFISTETQVINKNYNLSLTTNYEPLNSVDLDSTKIYSLTLNDNDSLLVEDSKINSFTIATLNNTIATLIHNNGDELNYIVYNSLNSITFGIKSRKKSGLVPIKVVVEFVDVNGITKTIEEIFDIVVYSGPPSAISFSYINVSKDEYSGRFVDRWLISVNDEYGNAVNTTPSIAVGGIFGYRKDSAGNRLYVEPDETDNNKDSMKNWVYNELGESFLTSNKDFSLVDDIHDKLVIFTNANNSDGYSYEVSGKWDFERESTDSNDYILKLLDNYSGNSIGGIGFAIGYNYRENICQNGKEALGYVSLEESTYMLNESGEAIILVEYEPYLVGKDIMLWANITGLDKNQVVNSITRLGESQKITLKGMGLTVDECESIGKLDVGSVVYDISVSQTIPDIPNMLEPYENSNFVFEAIASGTVSITNIITSNDFPLDSRCDGGYTDTNLTASWVLVSYDGGSEGGTICVDATVSNEF
jgi:hypothetical protein